MKEINLAVEEFTSPNPVVAEETLGIDELKSLMAENEIRHLPIVRDKKLVGILSERDLKLVDGLDVQEKALLTAKDIMVADPETVNSQDPLDEVALKMSEKKIGSVIVVEGDDNLLGIFTATDALNALVEVARAVKEVP